MRFGKKKNRLEEEDLSHLPRWKRLWMKYGLIGVILYSVKGLAMLFVIPWLFPNFVGCGNAEEIQKPAHIEQTQERETMEGSIHYN